MAPGGSRPTEPPEAIQAECVLELPPATARALSGFGGVTGKWARSMSAAGNVPFDLWQSAHCESSGSGPAGCARPVPLMFDCVRPAALSFSVRPVAVVEVDAVVAGAAGEGGRLRLPVVAVLGLGRARRRARAVVARRAVADVLRIRGMGRQHAGVVVVLVDQVLPHVDLVNVVREVADRTAIDEPRLGGERPDRAVRGERGLRLAVAALLGVTDHAVLGFVAAAAMEARGGFLLAQPRDAAELAVAGLAVGDGDDLAREVGRRDLGPGRRNEVVDGVGRMLHRHRRRRSTWRRSACCCRSPARCPRGRWSRGASGWVDRSRRRGRRCCSAGSRSSRRAVSGRS